MLLLLNYSRVLSKSISNINIYNIITTTLNNNYNNNYNYKKMGCHVSVPKSDINVHDVGDGRLNELKEHLSKNPNAIHKKNKVIISLIISS